MGAAAFVDGAPGVKGGDVIALKKAAEARGANRDEDVKEIDGATPSVAERALPPGPAQLGGAETEMRADDFEHRGDLLKAGQSVERGGFVHRLSPRLANIPPFSESAEARPSGAFDEKVFEREITLKGWERRAAPDAGQALAAGLGRCLDADHRVPGVAAWAIEARRRGLGHRAAMVAPRMTAR